MKQVVCPICGSKDLVQKTKSESITVPFSEPVEVTENMFLCNVCGESGDFTGENDQLIDAAGLFAVKKSALNILGYLTEHGVTMAYLERAMDLPIRTASRWKEGHISAPAVALLRCLRTYPWLIDVADNDFNADFAKAELVKNALDSFGQLLDQNNIGINTLSCRL